MKFYLLLLFLLSNIILSSVAYQHKNMPMPRSFGVAAQEPIAQAIGEKILQNGGNAIDAAIAVATSLAVTLPEAGNIAGGGFMMIYIKKENKVYAIDYREKAPLSAYTNMFVNENNTLNKTLSQDSVWATGVPGTVAGLYLAWEHFATLSWKELHQDAIKLAKNGFIVPERLHQNLKKAQNQFLNRNHYPLPFFPKNNAIKTGELLIQTDLANSLEVIANDGPIAFYNGPLTPLICDFIKEQNGLITPEDFARYKSVFRNPVSGNYKGYQIFSMPPPSSGGVLLLQLLDISSNLPLQQWGYQDTKTIQALSEAMAIAYQDRSRYLGDPDFITNPLSHLLDPHRNKSIAKKIKIAVSKPIRPKQNNLYPSINIKESNDTTHFSIIDKEGNMVSNTYTLNLRFGNKIMVPQTGILLNNEMDDLSAGPDIANAYGLTGSKANEIEAEKRMLSSMTPTLVLKNNEPFLATGSPGGSRIISIVFQTLINMIDFNMNINEASHAPRIHYQWKPDILFVEQGINMYSQQKLLSKGYELAPNPKIGSIQSVFRDKDLNYSVNDPRTTPKKSILANQ